MFGKALGKLKGLGTSSKAGSSGQRVKLDLQVVQVERLPQSVRKCRVMWSRNAKVQMTALKDVRNGGSSSGQVLGAAACTAWHVQVIQWCSFLRRRRLH